MMGYLRIRAVQRVSIELPASAKMATKRSFIEGARYDDSDTDYRNNNTADDQKKVRKERIGADHGAMGLRTHTRSRR